jgi:hypothetical protein
MIYAAGMNIEMSRQDISSLIAEHSICQPGKPLPHGLSNPSSFRCAEFPDGKISLDFSFH